jgi:hypothetical protein
MKNIVWNAQGTEHGILTGNTRACTMEGCPGTRYDVKWPDGKITRPCGKGLRLRKDGSQEIMA